MVSILKNKKMMLVNVKIGLGQERGIVLGEDSYFAINQNIPRVRVSSLSSAINDLRMG